MARLGSLATLSIALLGCDARAPTAPPSPNPPPPEPHEPTAEVTAADESTLVEPAAVEPPPRVDLGHVAFYPLDSEARGAGVRVILGVVEAPLDDDDQWSVADGIGASAERTRIETSTRSLRNAKIEGLGPLPKQLVLVGEGRICTAPLPERARVQNDGEGFELATISVALEGCGDPGTKQGWSPLAIAGGDLPDTLRYVPAVRRVYVAEGKVVRGDDALLPRIMERDTAPPGDTDEHGPGLISGFVDEVPGVSPSLVAVFAGLVYPHAPLPPREPEPCEAWAEWDVTVGRRSAGATLDEYAVHAESGAVDLVGAFVYEGHVQAVLAEVVLDLAVLLPGPFQPGDQTEGFVDGRWIDVPTGHHHDEDAAFARVRLGDACEP